MKGWEYWKDQLIERQINSLNNRFKLIEERGLTPIENIAFVIISDYIYTFYDPGEIMMFSQARIDKYTVDFLIEDKQTDLNIIIECDGHDFHEKTKKQAAHDKKRDRYFTKRGYVLLRYTGSQICENPDEIANDIDEIILSQKKIKAI